MNPGDHSGMVFMAFFSLIGIPFGMGALILGPHGFLHPLCVHAGEGPAGGHGQDLIGGSPGPGGLPCAGVLRHHPAPDHAAIVSGMLLAFAMSIDDVIISVFVTGPEVNTLPINIYTQFKKPGSPRRSTPCAPCCSSPPCCCAGWRPGWAGARKKLKRT